MNAPIGILDSGLGGLTIWQEIQKQLLYESTIYIGDHAYQPYGGRSADAIRRRVKRLITFLVGKGAKLVVVACNTATIAGIDQYRRWFPRTPIIGVVPVVKTAAAITKTKHIAVLSTPYTAASRYQKRLIHTFANGCCVENISVPNLVSLIEKGNTGARVIRIPRTVDVVVLGCTHYPFVTKRIAEVVGKGVTIIDSGGAVARHVGRVLAAEGLQGRGVAPYTEWYTTGNPRRVSSIAKKLTGEAMVFAYAAV